MSYRGGNGGGGGGGRGGGNQRGGGRGGHGGGNGGGNGGSSFSPRGGRGGGGSGRGGGVFTPSPSPFNSPPPARGGRGGYNNNRGGYHGPHVGGGSPGFGSPQQSPSPSPGPGGSPHFGSPSRPHCAGFHPRGGGAAGRFGQPSFGSPNRFGSPHGHGPPSNLVSLGEFNMDERTLKSAVSLSLKMGAAGLEDAHIGPVVLPFLREKLAPHLRTHYQSYRRDQILLNIELQDNYLTCMGVRELCAHFCAVLSEPDAPYRLAALKLWNNKIGDDGCVAIAQLLTLAARCDAPVAEVHLSHNLITERGAAALFSATYEYGRADSPLTKIDTKSGVASASASAVPAAAAAVPFVLPSNCVDTGAPIPAPASPLWLRLEWNLINYSLFAPYFAWLKLDPQALKKEAKRARQQVKRAATAAAAAAGATAPADANASPAALPSRQSSEESADADADGAEDGADADDFDRTALRNDNEADSNDEDDAEDAAGADEYDEEGDGEEDEAVLEAAEDEESKDDGAPVADALAGLSLQESDPSASPDSPTNPSRSSLSFALPPLSLRICPAANRTLCAVRSCKYGTTAHAHVCFFTLQHQSFENSDLLSVLQKQRKQRKIAKPAPISERQTVTTGEPAQTAEAAAAAAGAAASSSSSSAAAAAQPVPASVLEPSISSSVSVSARPLVIFLDTNSVFGMISERKEAKIFNWNNLYSLAVAGRFGSCFPDPDRRVYLVLCSAVLNEMDARKEYSKKAETGLHASARFSHLSTLARQIKSQFQMNVADQSAGFLARAKNLGGVGQGFVKTVSVAQGEANVLPSLRPSASDTRNTSNDRRILNAALHWIQTIAETGVVLLLTDDRNLANLAATEQVPSVGLYALDRALDSPQFAGRPIDSVTMREAIASCSQDLKSSLSNENIQPAPRMDKNVYEALEDAVALVQKAMEHPQLCIDKSRDELSDMIDCWKGVLANAPSLLTSLRNNRNAHQSPPAKATTKTET